MKQRISLSIFFPAYNEEKNIREAVTEAVRVAEESPFIGDYEVIVVNDGSHDATEALVCELQQEYPRVRLVSHTKNRGYGAALISGIQAATKEFVFFTDADLQFDIIELQNLLVHLTQYKVVIGYRAPRRDPFLRLLNAKAWNRLNRVFFGLRVRDIDCAFKIFNRELVQNLSLSSRGAMISSEILIRLSRAGIAIKEVPVSHLPRVAGSPTGAKLSVIIRAFREMIRLYWGELGLVTNKQVFKFMCVGVINTLLDIGVYILLTRTTNIFSSHIIAAKFFSFLTGTISSLILNRAWTFGLKNRLTLAEVIRFYTVTSIGIAINIEAMNILIHLGVYDLIALALTTVFTFGFNFMLSKFWIFKITPKKKATFARQS